MTSELRHVLSSSTTKADILKEINEDKVISKVLEQVTENSELDGDEIANDAATLIAARMDYIWKTAMTNEMALMEGIADVTEEYVESVSTEFQKKYKLKDEHIEEIHQALLTNINKDSLSRCAQSKANKFNIAVTVFLCILKIVLFFVVGPGVIFLPF